jgi:hypothetical protein
MTKALFAVAVLAGIALAARQDDLSRIVPGAEKAKKATKKLTADQAKAIAAAIGLKPEEVETSVVVLDGYAPIPEEPDKGRVLATIVTVKGAKGALKVGVAIAADFDKVVAVRVLENKDDKAAESKTFLAQFESGYEWTAAIRKSPAELAAALEKAKGNKEGATLAAFIKEMHRVGALWDRVVDKQDKGDTSGGKDSEEIGRIYDALAKRVGDLSFLNDRQKGTVKTDLEKAARACRDLTPKVGDKKDETKKQVYEVGRLCSSCHGPMSKRFRDARDKQGIGNGYLSPDLDITVPLDGPRELYESMAKSIRKAILQLRDAK